MNSMRFPKLSLVLNILVLIPVCSGLLLKANWVVESYGIETPARGLLLSIYLAILICSVLLLFKFDSNLIFSFDFKCFLGLLLNLSRAAEVRSRLYTLDKFNNRLFLRFIIERKITGPFAFYRQI